MKLSNTKAGTFNRCPKKYEFGYVLKLKKKVKSLPLERGSWLHTLVEVWYADDPNKRIEVDGKRYKVGTDWRKAHRILTKKFNSLFEEERAELGDLPDECLRIMLGYIERYEEEDADEETLAVELDEWVKLPNGDMFNFIIDRVLVRSDGGVWLQDHKSVGQFMDPGFMLIDSQLARYFWGFTRLPDPEIRKLARRLRGVEFNEIRTKPPTIPELVLAKGQKKGGRKELTRRANLDTDVATYMKAIEENGFDPKDYKDVLTRLRAVSDDKFFRRTPLTRDNAMVRQMMIELMDTSTDIKRARARGRYKRVPDKSCTWGCDFYEPCQAELNGLDITDILELKYVPKKEDEKDGQRKHRVQERR